MTYVVLPEQQTLPPITYDFAVEAYVARHFRDDDYFFIWQTKPTVILGRNQLLQNEVNVDYCREHGVFISRRKSGGGCVYSDEGNIMFSFINREPNVQKMFANCMHLAADALHRIGVPVTISGRNDILLDGKKVSGAAFYRTGDRSIMHNTLLVNSDLSILERVITPDKAKLQSKGVQSVRQHVGNISQYTTMSLPELKASFRQAMCGDKAITITEEMMPEIRDLQKSFAADDFIYGKQPLFKLTKKHRLPGVGTIEACLEIKDNHIHDFDLFGDYFLTGDLDEELLPRLRDVAFTREAVEKALQGLDLDNIIRGLTVDGLLRVLFGRKPHVMKPEWLKIDLSSDKQSENTSEIIHGNRLHTICESGLCPNRAECWRLGTATLMIGGDICTRHCRFCNTLSGRPLPLCPDEPQRVAESVKKMNLRHVVLTSVDRDDLPDMGAEHWRRTVEAVRQKSQAKIEVLLPDFQGRDDLMDIVLQSHPDVVAHNIETVRRLTPSVRSVATYEGSLHVLKHIHDSGFVTKSGLMLGLGETEEEVLQTLHDLRDCGVERVTIGQYLQPTARHLPVEAYITPEKFRWYHEQALKMGFRSAVCGPLVRSSYKASIG